MGNTRDHQWLLVDLRYQYNVEEVVIVTGKYSGLDNFDVGVTDIPLAADKPPTSLATADYHICGAFVDTLPTHSRVRLPCESARGRYVFVRARGDGGLAKMMICEMEVYVQCKNDLIF
ncbi:hypothetical protein NP493_5522g00000 [Ridgeia piscesae]|uniref:Fucolectin tachylectin-4 pentraxin-1 domain-containing protein n=1 Tax=Ridgeia piscesae TaxID=27915 RepID=A0AAD9MPR7_RIDPI|nr:hypothetical protein NP493_5522g00000 [Ridgeia piscesae]